MNDIGVYFEEPVYKKRRILFFKIKAKGTSRVLFGTYTSLEDFDKAMRVDKKLKMKIEKSERFWLVDLVENIMFEINLKGDKK